ncbi:pentatricopeptide repeat-containing protein At4g02750-like [Selaginella moellendorffii]|uniref:pentatricopeptide repeat-containing protein At4g02750-like n=1 Tax=Selaginella moellendorffii TaxID=88036 RepID=UPI000D1C76B7|nr:pentatricopeptide repeat-containing protein At4g02750-like [Selaginella moellendorffii]|eukprot:XP_024542104.1 pentatricopeptide repeat-containing protein At4g02750-like [Selaginella moellendorffii]
MAIYAPGAAGHCRERSISRRFCEQEVRAIHSQIREGGHGASRFLGNQLVKMYGRCGSVEEALAVFQSIRDPNVYSWNLMISAYAPYAQNGHIREARKIFEQMPERNLVSWNSMVSGYAQAGMVAEAKKLFDQMPRRDLVSWTAMITAFAKGGQGKNAIKAFGLMDLEGFQADSVSFAATIDSCGDLRDGRLLHADVLASSSAGSDVIVLTSLVAMYGRCFSVEDARTTFEMMKNTGLIQNSVLPWNAMVVAYAQSGRGQDAIRLFLAMDLDGVRANEFTFASVFDACSSCGAASLAHARIIHSTLVEESESLPSSSMDDVVVGTALVNMYGKFGCLEDSKRVFDAMTSRNVLSVTAMIEAYSQAGLSRKSLEVFRESTGVEGLEPDAVLFVSVLSACSHGGLLAEGCQIFVSIGADYEMILREDHYMCLIDLLGRAGKIDEAVEVISNMPYEPNSVSWTSLLSGCATQGSDFARRAADNAMKLEPRNSGAYKLLVQC